MFYNHQRLGFMSIYQRLDCGNPLQIAFCDQATLEEEAMMTNIACRILITVFHLACLSGCAVFPVWSNANVGPVLIRPNPTRATTRVDSTKDLKEGVFLGIAMSGGGSRAANFAAASLLELEDLGILRNATAISSVSGSSLTAAYYGLFSTDDKLWNRKEIRERLIGNFELEWVA